MPKLPTDADLGGLPNAESGRPVSSVDTTAIGSGVAAFGQGVANLGTSIESYAEKEKAKQGVLEITGATSGLSADLINTNARFQSDQDTNYTTWGNRFKTDAEQALATRAAQISDPRRRQLFIAKSQDDIARSTTNVDMRARNLINTAQQTTARQQVDSFTDQAFAPGVEEPQREKILAQREASIDASIKAGIFTEADGLKLKKDTQLRTDKLTLQSAPPEERLAALSGPVTGKDAILDRIGGIENSTGNPAAKNPNSSATGNFQFIKDTWLGMIRRYKPDIANGRSDSEILSLRADPKLSREMAGKLLDENGAKLQRAGIEATPGNLYLAHFLGPGDAIGVLKAPAGTPVDGLVNSASVDANKSVLAGKTTDSVIGWANRRMGQSGASYSAAASRLSPEERTSMYATTRQQIQAGQQQQAIAAEQERTQWVDNTQFAASKGQYTAVQADQDFQAGRFKSFEEYNGVKKLADAYEEAGASADRVIAKLSAGQVLNPRDAKDKAGLSALDQRSGLIDGLQQGDPNAGVRAAQQFGATGMVSDQQKGLFEGMVRSNNPQQVQYAMSTLDGMYRKNPNAFVDAFGGGTFGDLQKWQGLADQGPQAFIDQMKAANDPAQIRAREEYQKQGRKVASDMTDAQMLAAVDDSWFRNPSAPWADQKYPGMGVYREEYSRYFSEGMARNNGDQNAAKTYAVTMMRQTWADSSIGGGKVMKFAPEAPEVGLPRINGSLDWAAKQVREVVRAKAGSTVLSNELPTFGSIPGVTTETAGASVPDYALVPTDQTKAEIDFVRSGGRLPNGRQSPAWQLVYTDPNTGLKRSAGQFYFDVPKGVHDDEIAGRSEGREARNVKSARDTQSAVYQDRQRQARIGLASRGPDQISGVSFSEPNLAGMTGDSGRLAE